MDLSQDTYYGDPIPKPKLSDERKFKLDSIVRQMISNKESDAAIQSVVDDYKSKYATTEQPSSKAFQVNISEPTFKSTPNAPAGVREFSGKEFGAPPPNEAAMQQLHGEALKAKNDLNAELQGNDEAYTQKLREFRRDNYTLDDLKKEYAANKAIIPVGKEQETLRMAKLRQYNLPVTKDDISDFKMGTILSSSQSRKFLSDLNKPSVQAKAYKIDAFNHAAQSKEGSSRIPQIKENAKLIEKGGDYGYDPASQTFYKKEGFLSSVVSGRNDLNQLSDFYDELKSRPNEDIIKTLNEKLTRNIDQPVSVPAGKISELGRTFANQPLKGMLAGTAAAVGVSLLGNPEVSHEAFTITNAALSAQDMYKIGYANSVQSNYGSFKQQGLSDEEALNKAKELADKQAPVDAAIGGIMALGSSKFGFKGSNYTLNALKQPLANALLQMGETTAKKAVEGFGVGAAAGLGQIVKNLEAQNAGLPVETTAGFKDQVETGALLTMATHAIATGVSAIKKPTLQKLASTVASLPQEAINDNIASQVKQGAITEDQARQAQDIIQKEAVLDKLIPSNIPYDDRQSIKQKIRKIDELKADQEKLHEAYHPEIKEKINKLKEEIVDLSKGPQRAELEKLITNEVKAGNVHESAAEHFMGATGKELEGYMKDIAGMAHDPQTEPTAIQAFGQKIVDKAKELYPQQKTTENASPIRSNEGQISLGGNEPSSSKKQSSSDIQLPEEQKPILAETQQQAGGEQEKGNVEGEEIKPSKMEGGIPPNMFDLPFTPEEGDVGRLAHKDTEELYRDLGLGERIPRATKTDIDLENEADQMIKNGYDFEGKADRVLSGRDKSFTDAEQVAFAKMVGALNIKLKEQPVNSPEFNATLDTIDRLSRASDKVGSEEGAAFRARRMFVLNDETLSSFYDRAKKANMDMPLSDEQKLEVKDHYDKFEAAKKGYEDKIAELEAANKKLKAEKNIKEIPKGEKKTSEDYKADRKSLIEQLKEQQAAHLKKMKEQGIHTMGGLGKLVLTPEMAKTIGKIVKSYVQEGVDKLEDLIKAVHGNVKDIIEGISENDIHDVIAGEYSVKQTKSEIQKKLFDLQTQAKLITQLEKLKSGAIPKTTKAREKRNAQIESLRQQIKDLTGRPEKTEEQKLSALKSRYKKMTDELQEKIDKGDIEPEEQTPLVLDKEALDLKDAYIKKKKEWVKYVAEQEYKNRSTKQKTKDFFTEVLNVPRTVMASADLSAPLRQGLVLTVSHPQLASKAFVESLRQAISPERFDRWLFDLKESDYYKNVLEKAGLYIADPNNLKLSAKEEQWMSNIAEKFPLIGDTLKFKVGDKNAKKNAKIPGLGIISKSERAYVAYLNKLRVDTFMMYDNYLRDLKGQNITPETRPDIYEALGSYINNATGRGELGELEKSAQVLNSVFFSPRLIASRINLLNPIYYTSLPKEVRNMAVLDMAKMVGAGALTLGLLSAVKGVSVENDIDSPDFGKVKVGNTRWDIWGGFQQYIRLAAQLLSGYEKKANGAVVPLGGQRGENTRADKLETFFRGKLAPIPSIAADLLTGKTTVGEPVTLGGELKEHFIPMIGNDVSDAWKEQGPMSMLFTGIPSLFGVGTTTYEEKTKQTSTRHHVNHNKSRKGR